MFATTLTKKCLALALLVGGLTAGASQAHAQLAQPIYVQNDSPSTVYVAARYIPAGGGNTYVTRGFWKVEPGERKYLFENNGVVMYIHGDNMVGRAIPGAGTPLLSVLNGVPIDLYAYNTGNGVEPFTVRFR